MDDFKIRFLSSIVICFIFIFLKTSLGIFNAYIITISSSIIIVLYLFIIDGIKIITLKRIYISAGILLYFIIIAYLFPSNKLYNLDIEDWSGLEGNGRDRSGKEWKGMVLK